MLRLPILCLFCLAVVGFAHACGDDASEAPDDADDPTGTATASADPDAAARGEAMEFCPEELQQSCAESWLETGRTSLPWALCVDENAGTWFQEPPGGVPGERAEGVEIGDACSGDPSHTVVALHNYP